MIDGARSQELVNELWIMRFLVSLQNGRTRKRFSANGTPKRSLSGVHSTMVFHVMAEFEGFAAIFALEGSISRVDGQMGYQRTHVRKRLSTKFTQNNVCLTCVAERKASRKVVVAGTVGRLLEGFVFMRTANVVTLH